MALTPPLLRGRVSAVAVAAGLLAFLVSGCGGQTAGSAELGDVDHADHDHDDSDVVGPEEDLLDQTVREALLAEARRRSVPLTPTQDAALRSCAGDAITDRFATGDYQAIDELAEEDRQLYFSCVEQEGLEEAVTVVIDVTEIPAFIENHNQETAQQVECLMELGWDINMLAPDEEGLLFWEPPTAVFDEDGQVSAEFATDADSCANVE